MRVVVLGAGAWGTALSIRLSKQHDVTLWSRDADCISRMQQGKKNSKYLPNTVLPDNIYLTSNFSGFFYTDHPPDLFVIATSFAGLRPMLSRLKKTYHPFPPTVWLCKGIETTTMKLGHQIAYDILSEGPPENDRSSTLEMETGVLVGPSFAQEVAQGLPVALTIASHSTCLTEKIINIFHSTKMRIYPNVDILGVELGSALKNVIAIAVGISDGLNLGLNARAALITRGAAEISRLGVAMGASKETFMGLSGLGDLVLTCTGDLSRNRLVGYSLAQGKSLNAILSEIGHVAEGVLCVKEAVLLAKKYKVEMPITQTIAGVLFNNLKVSEAPEYLMSRQTREEML